MIARSGTDNTARGKTSESRSAKLLRALQAVDLAGAAAGLRAAQENCARLLEESERVLAARGAARTESARARARAPAARPGARARVMIKGEPALAPIPLARTAGVASVAIEWADAAGVQGWVPPEYYVRRLLIRDGY